MAPVIVRLATAALAAEYGASPERGRTALNDALFTMQPPPASSMSGTTARMQLNVPVRFTPTTRAHSLSVYWCNGLFIPRPALFTRSVTPPIGPPAASIGVLPEEDAAPPHPKASPPIAEATERAASTRRSSTATRAPSSA